MATMDERILPMPYLTLDEIWRFRDKIEISIIDFWGETPCHDWMSARNTNGYGSVTFNYIKYNPTRIAYWLDFKKDPGKLFVCHGCNRPCCVSPLHLYLDTARGNNLYAFGCGNRNNQGSLNTGSKLYENDIVLIRDEFNNGSTLRELSEKFNVLKTCIHKIVHRRRWDHVK